MAFYVNDVTSDVLGRVHIGIWHQLFAGTDHVISLGIEASSLRSAQEMRQYAAAEIDSSRLLVDEEATDYPMLFGFTVHFQASVNESEQRQQLNAIESFWEYVRRHDPGCRICAHDLCTYWPGQTMDVKQALQRLDAAMSSLRTSRWTGNLSFARGDEDDQLIEMYDSSTGAREPLGDIWRSDLSSNDVHLVFGLDAAPSATQETLFTNVRDALGTEWLGGDGTRFAEWSRNVQSRGVDIGSEAYLVAKPPNRCSRCGVSVSDWRRLGLQEMAPFPYLSCHNSSKDMNTLSLFMVQNGGERVFKWPLPSLSMISGLFAIGVSFVWR